MKTKICTKCEKRKLVKEFGVRKATKDGLNYQCKECAKENNREYYKDNPEKINKKNKKWARANPEKVKQNILKWREANPEYKKEHYKANAEKMKQSVYKWQAANPKKVKQIAKKTWAKRKQMFDGKHNASLGRLLSMLVKGTIKSSRRLEWVFGRPSHGIRNHFFSQLKPGMTLANYGTKWEIDHIMAKAILPYESFDDPNFKKLWCLENLRPLWKKDNRQKGTKAA